jgi:hypothetical protein
MTLSATPRPYLDKALGALRDLGLVPERSDGHEAPIVALLQQISDLDEERVVAITRTLSQSTLFNEVVRAQVEAMDIGERYERLTRDFDSIRDDAKMMVDQVEDGKIDTRERLANLWMKVTRGDIADRFERIKRTYLDVTASAQDQIRRENVILEAYQDFRGALKQAEVLAFEVLRAAEAELEAARRPSTRPWRRSTPSRATTRPSGPGSSSTATSGSASCSGRTGATRSPRTSPTT